MKYAITSDEHAKWEPCNAKTLAGAKGLAVKAFSEGFNSDMLYVAEVHGKGCGQFFITVAERPNSPGGTWRETR